MGGIVIPLNKGSEFELDVPWVNADKTPANLTGFAATLFDTVNTATMTATVGGVGNQFVQLRMTGANVLANLLMGPVNTFRIRLTPPNGKPITSNILVIDVR